MRIIKRSTLAGYWQKHPSAETGLRQWYEVACNADWESIQEVRKTFPHADAAIVSSGNIVTIFNIGGNDYRLVVSIKYRWKLIYIRDFLTHADYSKNLWKKKH